MPALSNWIGKSDLKEGVDVFYNQNLPTKYMQYFETMKNTEVDQAAEELNSAIKVFEGEKVTFKDPDINQDRNLDMADLALIAYYYHVESPEAQKADINNDKAINIYDLTIVANKILFGK